MSEENTSNRAPYEFYGKMPLKQAIPLGLQHVLAMFVGNLTPLLIICGVRLPTNIASDHLRCVWDQRK